MPIDKKDLRKAANEAAENERRKGMWRLYERYEFRHNDEGEAYAEVVPGGMSHYEEYQPLVAYPGLFLDFAQMVEEGEIIQEVWKGWIERYGVLGLEQHDVTRDLIERYHELSLGIDELIDELHWLNSLGREYRLYSGSVEGGPRESYRSFEREAHKANRLLRVYEAATAKDDLGHDRPDVAKVRKYAEAEGITGHRIETSKNAKGWAIGWVGYAVQEIIAEDCFPLLHQTGFKISRGWGFHTLLGAMYLQMAWLMTATEEVRCQGPGCTKIIRYDQPELSLEQLEQLGQRGYRKPYKPRSDKVFCDTPCKNRWRYQNVTKPKRESRLT